MTTPLTDRPTERQAPVGFAAALRKGTLRAHARAERRTFAGDLVKGRIDLDGYAAMLGQLFLVYDALEDVADGFGDEPQTAPFLHPELARRPALHADLTFLLGETFEDGLDPLPATAAYCDRIDEVASWPGGFVAHHYTRYLGDLSGGQIIGAMATQTYGFTGADGTRFYRFDGIVDQDGFKNAYRTALDEAPWDADEQGRIVEEAIRAFELNSALFDDLTELVEPRS